MSSIQADIEARLAVAEPDVEVLLAEVVAGDTLRLFVDHPDGVTLEVSSPGRKRPLTKPDHYRRYLGRRARIRTREERDGHKTFTGELVGAGDDAVTVAADTGVIAIPYADIHRSNLVEE